MRATKASGVDWLGEVPHNWDVSRLKRVFRRVKRELAPDLGIVTAFRDGEVTLRSNRRSEGFTEADDYSNYQRIEPNDLAIHAMDAFAGGIGVCDSSGMCSPVLSVCSPLKGSEPRYMAYVLRIMANRGWIEALSRSIRERTSEFRWAEAGAQHVPIPPNDEQRRIADFLDRETAKIDALIAKQEQLITTLDERRQAVILRAVTGALSSSDSFRPTHIEWLPKLPESWDLSRTRFHCQITTGSGDTQDAIPDGKFPFYVRSEQPLLSDTFEFDCDAVLTAGDGGVGKVYHLVSGKFMAHQRVYVMHSFKGVSPRFFYYFFSATFARVALEGGARTTVDSLRRPMLANHLIAIPPLAEQSKICDFLQESTQAIDRLAEKSSSTIRALKERRQALISAAVTGKLEVGV